MTFVPSDQCSWAVGEGGDLNVRLTTRAALELAEVIAPKRGTYRVQSFPALSIHVVKSEIRDHEGRVAEVIG